MKAMKRTNRTNRILTAVMILTMATATGYAQGLLAEGAMKLFDALTNNNTSEQSIFHQAKYSGQANEVADREFNADVVKSFKVEAVDITFEKEVNTESWMTESLTGEVESDVAVEEWMSTPMSAPLETPVALEEWMTAPMSDDLETDISAEEWMSTPLYASVETAPDVEDWMTAPLLNAGTTEETVQLETWMTKSLR